MAVNKLTLPAKENAVQLKINEVIDALGSTTSANIDLSNLSATGEEKIKDIFIATYGTTTLANIITAYNNGKTIIAKKTISNVDLYYKLIAGSTTLNQFIFASTSGSEISPYSVNNTVLKINSNGWSTSEYSAVAKSGDTMTGTLELEKSTYVQDESPCIVKFDDVIYGTNPSTHEYPHIIQVQDGNSDIIGSIEYQCLTTGERAMVLQAKKAGEDVYSTIRTVIDSNDNVYCSFPRTDCCDGQWVNELKSIISSDTSIAANTAKNYTITSYFPDDTNVYEVLVSAWGMTGTASGNIASISVYSSLIDTANRIAAAQTRTASSVVWCGACIIPIGTDRKIYIKQTDTNSACTCRYLRLLAYRRIGTNT